MKLPKQEPSREETRLFDARNEQVTRGIDEGERAYRKKRAVTSGANNSFNEDQDRAQIDKTRKDYEPEFRYPSASEDVKKYIQKIKEEKQREAKRISEILTDFELQSKLVPKFRHTDDLGKVQVVTNANYDKTFAENFFKDMTKEQKRAFLSALQKNCERGMQYFRDRPSIQILDKINERNSQDATLKEEAQKQAKQKEEYQKHESNIERVKQESETRKAVPEQEDSSADNEESSENESKQGDSDHFYYLY